MTLFYIFINNTAQNLNNHFLVWQLVCWTDVIIIYKYCILSLKNLCDNVHLCFSTFYCLQILKPVVKFYGILKLWQQKYKRKNVILNLLTNANKITHQKNKNIYIIITVKDFLNSTDQIQNCEKTDSNIHVFFHCNSLPFLIFV